MNCITSPALDNVEIAMYVDGEADDATVAHIQQCPYCRERARHWTRVQNNLRKRSYRVDCPTPMELGDYRLGYVSDAQKLVVARHVRECVLCQREIEELQSFFASLTPEAGLLGTAKVLIARLTGTQDGSGLAPVALRGEAKGPLTFEADGVVIILDLQPVRDGVFSLLGQVAAEDQEKWTGARVECLQGEELQFSMIVDDLGAFRTDEIGAGPKELRIIPNDGSLIVVSNFML